MSNPRTTQRDIDRQLQDAWIVMKDSHAVADPLVFLRAELGAASDAIVVIEETDRVVTLSLATAIVTDRTLHLHAFSKDARAQARVARTISGWVGDSARECDASAVGARKVRAQDGRVMCLGERTSASSAFAEARISPYEIPVRPESKQLDVVYRNYHEEIASGPLVCIAHRAIEFLPREVK